MADLTAVVEAGTKVVSAAGKSEGSGTVLKSAAGGASLGATIGSIFPGVGTVIGGAVGGLLGGIFGFLKKKKAAQAAEVEKKHDAKGKEGTSTEDVTKPKLFDGILKFMSDKPALAALIGIGTPLAAMGIAFGIKALKKKKADAAEAAKLAEDKKIDPPQTFNRSMGYDPFAGRQDYFTSPYATQNYSRPAYGFGPTYASYPPPQRPMYQPARPQFAPRMAQFNAPNPFGPRPPYGRIG